MAPHVAKIFAALDDAGRASGGDGKHPGLDVARYLGFAGFFRRQLDDSISEDGRGEVLFRRLEATVLRETALDVHEALTDAAVPHFFFKGVALVGDVYEPGDRDMVDIDVHVHYDARQAAVDAVRALGFRPDPEEEQAGPVGLRIGLALHRETAHTAMEGVSLDMHWAVEPVNRLLPRPDRQIDDSIWTAVVQHADLPVPSDPYHVVLLIHHLVHHDLLHLRGFLDLALLWSRLPPDCGPTIAKFAQAVGVLRITRLFAAMLSTELGLTVPSGLGVAPTGWRASRFLRHVRLSRWIDAAAGADQADHEMITRARILRRLTLVERASHGLLLLQDALLPPAEHLRWRWPQAPSRFAAWRRHVGQITRKLHTVGAVSR